MLNPLKIKLLIFLVIIIRFAFGTIHTVKKDGSGDFITIHEALNTASNHDVIVVYPGIYEGRIKISKEFYLRSTDPLNQSIVESTVIQSTNSNSSAVYFYSLRGTLSGFTIREGKNGINHYYSDKKNITIKHNIIENNWDYGIYEIDGLICSNIIRNNMNAGISSCDGMIEYNIIHNNRAYGIYGCDNIIRHNNIYENWNSGIYYCDGLIFDNKTHNL